MPSWRNPLTNKFESGSGPIVGQEGVQTPGAVPEELQPPPSGDTVPGAWDQVPTPENQGGAPGSGTVFAVADVLDAGQIGTDEADKSYGAKKSDDGPVQR